MPEIAEADVLLLESPPRATRREKLLQEAVINHLLGSELTRQQAGVLNYTFQEQVEGLSDLPVESFKDVVDSLALNIIKEHRSTGKTVRLLDANKTDHPELSEKIADMRQSLAVANQNDHGADQSTRFKQQVQNQIQFSTVFGETIKTRDDIIKQQVEAYAQEFASRSIAVVYGLNHTSIAHDRLRSDTATRVFVPDALLPAVDGAKRVYDLQNEFMRRVVFDKLDEPTAIDMASRILIRNSLMTQLAAERGVSMLGEGKSAWQVNEAEYDLLVQADSMARKLTPDEVAAFFAEDTP
jgi:hypothetical protein